jgi:LexA-binding, inner membrane-associated putative hydrolase
MFLGHFALALSAKKAAPKASLGTLVLSAQFADCLWPVLLLLGVEQLRIVPGLMPASPFDFVSYPISHSLLMQLVWGLLFGMVYLLWRRDLRTALIVGALLPTHWLLDYFAHRPDMPLYPGGGPKVGLGMWNSVPLTLLVEYGMFVAGVAIYLGATRPRSGSKQGGRNIAFWSLIIFLALVYSASLFGPPPSSVRVVAISALAIWLTIPWAAAADRHRDPLS